MTMAIIYIYTVYISRYDMTSYDMTGDMGHDQRHHMFSALDEPPSRPRRKLANQTPEVRVSSGRYAKEMSSD